MEEHGPWKTLKTETVYDSAWISVTKCDVINPGGKPTEYGTIQFKNLAIGIIVLDDEMNTYLVGQYRYPIKQYSWEIPEGGGSRNVDPLESAKRELKEETGITAGNWQQILHMHLSNSASDEEAIIYLARDLQHGEPEPEDDEEFEQKKLSFHDFYGMVEAGEITDSLTIAAAMKIKLMLNERAL